MDCAVLSIAKSINVVQTGKAIHRALGINPALRCYHDHIGSNRTCIRVLFESGYQLFQAVIMGNDILVHQRDEIASSMMKCHIISAGKP